MITKNKDFPKTFQKEFKKNTILKKSPRNQIKSKYSLISSINRKKW